MSLNSNPRWTGSVSYGSRRSPHARPGRTGASGRSPKAVAVALAIALMAPFAAGAQLKGGAGALPFDRPIRGSVPLDGRNAGAAVYAFEVGPDVFALEFVLSEAPADLDLLLFDRDNTLITFSELTRFNETLRISRVSDAALATGEYRLEVAYQYLRPPAVDGAELGSIPFTLTARAVRPQVRRTLRPGDRVTGELRPEEGMIALYRVDVPRRSQALRIDLSDTDGDLDIFVDRDAPPLDLFAADYGAQSFRSTEELVIDGDSVPPLAPGSYYVVVVDQLADAYPTPYTLSVSDRSDPPAHLREAVQIPQAASDLERAMLATVEILTSSGGGSGVLVSPAGVLLTNWHVVRGDDDAPEVDITVGLTLDPGRPAVELYRAEVIDAAPERDLALLRITEGRYGQPVGSTRFPFIELAADQRPPIGSPLRMIGYPSIGGTGSRATITLTRGTVAGYYRVPFGELIKSDAEINEGNSGGAALDESYRLVGLPTEVVGLDAGQIAYIYPVSAVPDAWLRIIAER